MCTRLRRRSSINDGNPKAILKGILKGIKYALRIIGLKNRNSFKPS